MNSLQNITKRDNNFKYKESFSPEVRKLKAEKYIQENQILIIIEPHRLFNAKITKDIFFLVVGKDKTMSIVMNFAQNQVKLKETDTLYFFCKNSLLNQTSEISEVYDKYKDPKDLILYVKVCNQEGFGNIQQ